MCLILFLFPLIEFLILLRCLANKAFFAQLRKKFRLFLVNEVRELAHWDHAARFLPAIETTRQHGAVVLELRSLAQHRVVAVDADVRRLDIISLLVSWRSFNFSRSIRRYEVLHAATFVVEVCQLGTVHFDVVVFAEFATPEEQSVVPLLADPAASVNVCFHVKSPAMSVLHGLLVPLETAQDELFVVHQLHRVLHELEGDALPARALHVIDLAPRRLNRFLALQRWTGNRGFCCHFALVLLRTKPSMQLVKSRALSISLSRKSRLHRLRVGVNVSICCNLCRCCRSLESSWHL